MVFFSRDYDEMVSDGVQKLLSNTKITNLSPGGKARFILDTIYTEQNAQFITFDTNLAQAFIRHADGKFLDLFGDIMNLPRLQSTHAEDTTENFMFYVETGTFGDINNGASFSIPAGTVVSTVPLSADIVTPGLDLQSTIVFSTITTATCLSGESFVFASIRARIEGSDSSLARSVLRKHSFEGYALFGQNLLKCTNEHAIQNGVDRESDQSYKYRLERVFKTRALATRAAVRLATLSVPGVADIVDVSAEQGPGTYSLYVKSLTPITSPAILREVHSAVSPVTGIGNRPYILAPTPLGLEFVATVSWSSHAKAEEISRGYAAMREATEDYFSGLEIGESVLFEEIVDVMLEAAPLAQRIGGIRPNEFDEIYVHRSDPLSRNNTTIRTLVYGSAITPLYNERIILETAGRFRGIQFR